MGRLSIYAQYYGTSVHICPILWDVCPILWDICPYMHQLPVLILVCLHVCVCTHTHTQTHTHTHVHTLYDISRLSPTLYPPGGGGGGGVGLVHIQWYYRGTQLPPSFPLPHLPLPSLPRTLAMSPSLHTRRRTCANKILIQNKKYQIKIQITNQKHARRRTCATNWSRTWYSARAWESALNAS